MSTARVVMSRSGESRPSICSVPRMAGTNSRITSQNSAFDRLSLIGEMLACSDSFSSNEVRSSTFCTRPRTSVATSQASSASSTAPSRRGAYSNSCVVSAANEPDTMARLRALNMAASVSSMTTQNSTSATTPSMSTGLPVVPEKRWLSRSAPSALRVPALTSAATNQPMMKIARAPSTCGMWTPIEFCSDIHIVFQSFIPTLLA